MALGPLGHDTAVSVVDVCPYCELNAHASGRPLILVGRRLFHESCARSYGAEPDKIDRELWEDPDDFGIDWSARDEIMANGAYEPYESFFSSSSTYYGHYDPIRAQQEAAIRTRLTKKAVEVVLREQVPMHFTTIAAIVSEEAPESEATPRRVLWALRRDESVVDTGDGIFAPASQGANIDGVLR